MDLIEVIQSEWAIRALVASMMVGITCGILGCFIVLRNMALIGDALSHAVLPGVVVAFVLFGYSILGFFVGSVVAGLVAAFGITWIQQHIKTKNDAAIGIVFTAMFSLGVMGISWISKREGVHLDLKDFLFGNVLGVSNQDLWLTLGISLYVVASVAIFYRYLFVSTFQPTIAQTMGISVRMIHYFLMLLLSFVVVASLQTVGVILVVAMLVTPASTALLLTNRLHWVLVVAGAVGLFSAVLGLILAILWNTTPGPAMAVVATGFYLMAALLAPKRGLLFRLANKRTLRFKIKQEDVLKQVLRLSQQQALTIEHLKARLGFSKAELQHQIKNLRRQGFMQQTGLALTATGEEEANRLVRAHRLWETYLVREIGLTEEQIHDEAEKYEHLLSKDILDEVDRKLGYPTIDPHGSPIPGPKGEPAFSLAQLDLHRIGKIASLQLSEQIASQLWRMGILPETELEIVRRDQQMVEVRQKDKTFQVPMDFARRVGVQPE